MNEGFDTVIDYLGARSLVDEMRYAITYKISEKLWKFLLQELKTKAVEAEDPEITERICEAKGSYVLLEIIKSNGGDVEPLIRLSRTLLITRAYFYGTLLPNYPGTRRNVMVALSTNPILMVALRIPCLSLDKITVNSVRYFLITCCISWHCSQL